MTKFYNIGIVATYEIQEIIEAESLKQALEFAEMQYYQGCYMPDDEDAFYHAPKFYKRDLKEEEK
jgi:hypothetical protein